MSFTGPQEIMNFRALYNRKSRTLDITCAINVPTTLAIIFFIKGPLFSFCEN